MTADGRAPQSEARRKAVVDALELCVARSELKDAVKPGTLEMYFATHADEVWGNNEVRLDGVWTTLCGRPGLSSKQVSQPLLVFKSFEQTLGMAVRLPAALAAVPPSEGVRLRGALALDEAEVARIVKDGGAAAAPSPAGRASAARPAAATTPSAAPVAPPSAQARVQKTVTALLLGVVTLAALGIGLFVAFRQTDVPFDVSDVAALVKLEDARRDGEGLVARIADAGWDAMAAERQKDVAGQLFDKQRAKGIKSVTLLDAGGIIRVQAMDMNGTRVVSVR